MEFSNTKDGESQYLSYLISGASKTGKTVLSTTVPSNQLLLCNIENNLASIYGADVNKVDCPDYSAVVEVVDWLEAQAQVPKWFFMDSGTELSKRLLREEMAKTKDGRAAFGETAQKIYDLVRRIKALPLNFVMIAQQGHIKDDQTGGLIFGSSFVGQQMQTDLPYMFDAVLATRVIKDDEGKENYVLQCRPCPQYQVGVRTKYNNPHPLGGFEKQDLGAIHNKILN